LIAHVPHGRNPHFNTVRVIKQLLEQLEKALKMLLKPFHYVLEDREKNVDADFTMGDL
jgi:hypothetical protein